MFCVVVEITTLTLVAAPEISIWIRCKHGGDPCYYLTVAQLLAAENMGHGVGGRGRGQLRASWRRGQFGIFQTAHGDAVGGRGGGTKDTSAYEERREESGERLQEIRLGR